mgnify:CR=1 FL=1
MAPVAGGGYAEFTGTSFATPFVTGSAALLMEWGIVKGNDPYLYGEKVKAYLRRGARQIPGYERWPNGELGYGRLTHLEQTAFQRVSFCDRKEVTMDLSTCTIRNLNALDLERYKLREFSFGKNQGNHDLTVHYRHI